MNKVYLDKNGKLFINGNEIKDVQSVSCKTSFTGTNIIIEFTGDYKCDFANKKVNSSNECTTE